MGLPDHAQLPAALTNVEVVHRMLLLASLNTTVPVTSLGVTTADKVIVCPSVGASLTLQVTAEVSVPTTWLIPVDVPER